MRNVLLALLSLACVACAYAIARITHDILAAAGTPSGTAWLAGSGVVAALAAVFGYLGWKARRAQN